MQVFFLLQTKKTQCNFTVELRFAMTECEFSVIHLFAAANSPETCSASKNSCNDIRNVQRHRQAYGSSQLCGTQQVGAGDEEHKHSGDQSDESGLFKRTQVDCRRKQCADGDHLIGPGKVVPQHIETFGILV